MTADLPIHSPIGKARLDSAFVRRALGVKEARRLSSIMEDAELRARARITQAARDAEKILADAKAEAESILAMLPDFAAIEAAPAVKGKSAFKAIRDVADAHGLPIAAVTRRGRDARATAARGQAVRAVSVACPSMSDADIGKLFSDMKASMVRRYRTGAA